MSRLRSFAFAALALVAAGVALQAQSGVSAPQVAANATGLAGQPARGITAVTRRTLMVAPGQQANAFFAAGGVNVAAPTTVAPPAAVPVAPAIVANPPGLQRADVQAALRQLAASGNAEARQLLRKPSSGVPAAATGASR
ncbi:MAG TPA: hypothetical protein VMB21_11960 [Candidatus Limnocylindria bacterium]|nr:hypothetical protein [Candidatus Limnocylindria bacterium]